MEAVQRGLAFTHYSETRSIGLLVGSLLGCGILWKIGYGYRILYAVIFAGYFFLNTTIRAGGRAPRLDLSGKIVLITGANTGIGKETAIGLAQQGATVVIACRDQTKMAAAVEEIKERSRSTLIDSLTLDISNFASVRTAAAAFLAKYDKLDILINNAGIAFVDYATTKDGLESTMGTNHYGHFLFTNLLMPAIKKAEHARIVNISSMAHLFATSIPTTVYTKTTYDKTLAYGHSKLANIYFTLHLQRLLRQSDNNNVTVYAAHPGAVATEIQRHNPMINKAGQYFSHVFLKTAAEGAETTIYCASSPSAVPGGYHIDCHSEPLLPYATDVEKAKELWERSEKITGIKPTI